jgi:class 3 adenylate cyclase
MPRSDGAERLSIAMSLAENVTKEVDNILSQGWDIRDGQVVPTTTDVALAGGGVKVNAAILYADLADSTNLAMTFDRRVAVKVYKAFLASSSRIIRHFGGEIRSFDGDRVMGIFIGDSKNSNAAKTALKINYAFRYVVKPKLEERYESLRTGSYTLKHGCGIDASEVLVVRGGIRNNNDLLWVGRAPNVAAKLSNIRRNDDYHTFISKDVHSVLNEEAKLDKNKNSVWKKFTWDEVPGVEEVYGSRHHWGL